MKYFLFHFSSITHAQSAKKGLEKMGISAYLVRTPLSLSETGCGYCLKVKKIERRGIEFLLQNFRTKIKGVYEERTDGYLQQVSF